MPFKETWSSRWVFILAAVGAAAGLGNLWRFPYMVYENGGGAFLFAYLLILLGFGIPLVIMEVAFGQRSQTEVVQAFRNTAGAFGRFVGWLTIGVVTLIAGYYAAVIAWGLDFLMASPTLAWGNDAQSFFHNQILGLTDSPAVWGGFSWPVVLGLIAVYTAVYFSIYRGLKSLSWVVKWTVPLPFLFLLILFINSLFLPGSSEGFSYFLVPDWSQLTNSTLWKNALTQAFFSMNIGLGLTILYASFNPQRQPVVQSGLLIALGDALVSIVAGLAMFGTLGWMAVNQGVDIASVVNSGPTLAFVTIPTALALLPFGAKLFSAIFFISILTLAIDSIFAMLELVSAALRKQFKILARFHLSTFTALLCTVFFLWSLCFAGGNGLYRLDILDHFVFGHLFYLTIFLQLIIIGWCLPIEKLRIYINHISGFIMPRAFDYLIKYIAPAVFIWIYVSALPAELSGNYENYPTDQILWWGLFPLILTLGVCAILATDKKNNS
jgi:NSS family neurotransmitter:Na+ symporter